MDERVNLEEGRAGMREEMKFIGWRNLLHLYGSHS